METLDTDQDDTGYHHNKKGRSFFADVLTLVSGTTIAQLIIILASPLITRLYGPYEFGLLAIFSSITGIIGVIACMRYEFAIMLPDKDELSANLLGLSLLIVAVVSVLLAVFLLFGQEILYFILNTRDIRPFFWLMPLSVFVGGILLALNYWNTRMRRFGLLSIAKSLAAAATTGTQLVAGVIGYATGGALILATILGSVFATTFVGAVTWRDHHLFLKEKINRSTIVQGLRRYKKFPIYDAPSALFNTVSWQLPIFILAKFFSPVIVGFYSLGFTVIQTPMNFIGGSISQVFFQRASEARLEGTLDQLVEKVLKLFIIIGMFPMLLLMLVGEDLFVFVFGGVWAEAGTFTQILSIWAFIWFLSSPLHSLYNILEKQDFGLKFNIANFGTRLAALTIGGVLGSPYLAIALFAISGIVVYGYVTYLLLVYSGVNLARVRGLILSNGALFLPAGAIICALKVLGVQSVVILVISVLLCSGYYLYIFKAKKIEMI